MVEAFKDLQGLFVCQNCGTVPKISCVGYDEIDLRCKCGDVNLNLIPKPKTKAVGSV